MAKVEPMYVGIEAEGRLTGVRTLFVPLYDGIDYSTVEFNAIEHRCPHIYLGVRGTYLKFTAPFSAVEALTTAGLIVTQEVDLLSASRLSSEALECPQMRYLLTLSPDTPWTKDALLDPILALLERPNVELKIDGHLKTAVYWQRPQIVPLHYCRDKEV